MPEAVLDQLHRALDAFGALVDGVPDGAWASTTPCPGWTVADLVGHVVTGNHLFAAALEGGDPPPSGEPRPAAYRESATALRSAFVRPGALERDVSIPAGTMPAAVALHIRITELLVHGWDLARATGRSTAVLPDDLAARELEFTRGALDRLPPGRSPFAPPQPAPDDAPAIDRLAALLGRALPDGRA
jgi:uncharacterized protein (TIGR03086 family)